MFPNMYTTNKDKAIAPGSLYGSVTSAYWRIVLALHPVLNLESSNEEFLSRLLLIIVVLD